MSHLPSCDDFLTSIETPQLIKAEALRGGSVVHKNGKILRYSGGFCIVFPYNLRTGKKVAVRCWHAAVPEIEKRCSIIAQSLKQSGLPYFVGFEYYRDGIVTSKGPASIVVMDWVDAMPLKTYIGHNLNNRVAIESLASNFREMVGNLHKHNFSHGDLQHGNIMVGADGRVYLVDYDSMYVPGLDGVSDEVKGLAGYQHPARVRLQALSPKSDYFSELIIYTGILALAKYPQLWHALDIEDTETLLFSAEDIEHPGRSKIISELKRDTDLKYCVEAIEKALSVNDIETLLPLEEAIISETTRVIGNLQSKWQNNNYVPPQPQSTIDLDKLRRRWDVQAPASVAPSVDITSITKKWK